MQVLFVIKKMKKVKLKYKHESKDMLYLYKNLVNF